MRETADIITLRGLSAVGHHGVYEFERSGSQVFSADITLFVDSRQAAQTDDVAHTVDYSQIAEDAVAILTGTPVYLLETLADKLATEALKHPLVRGVEVTVHKPMAPIRHQFSDVSVTIRRDKQDVGARTPSKKVVLALGSNLGDSRKTLTAVLETLIGSEGIEIDEVSSLYETRPVLAPGMTPQGNYVNAVIVARTVLSASETLALTQQIETDFGRQGKGQWQPRTVDIDIIDFDGQSQSTPELTLPHPRAASRAFVLRPWAEVEPDAVLPGVGQVAKLAEKATDRDGIVGVTAEWYLDEVPEEAEAQPKPEASRPQPVAAPTATATAGSAATLYEQLVAKHAQAGTVPSGVQLPTVAPIVTQAQAKAPNLPDWRRPSEPVRIVDTDTEYDAPASYQPRRTVVRPTPTGAVALPRGTKDM